MCWGKEKILGKALQTRLGLGEVEALTGVYGAALPDPSAFDRGRGLSMTGAARPVGVCHRLEEVR